MSIAQRHGVFILILLALLAANATVVAQTVAFSLHNNSSSHIVLIPFISAALVFRSRKSIFSQVRTAPLCGGLWCVAGLAILIAANVMLGRTDRDFLPAMVFGAITAASGAFVLVYGTASFRVALFPMLFLLFTVPIPESLLKGVVLALQKGTAGMVAVLFNLSGTPSFRQGLSFSLPGVTIEIAPQCSGIRSSMSLVITCLLAGYLMLDSYWKRLVLVLAAVPMAMFKNAVRIFGLSLLAIRVDMRFLTGSSLHHDGGILFFILALVLLSPLLWLLRRSERGNSSGSRGVRES